ncbi:cytidine deaminase-like protein [Lasiosphaeria miniovina]|uniref:Cytidine deaminase-like protein n=1 Tax=Lasiosphaeria miniovina TaxID=1954250 RepID=A0AA40DS20_9PEZI|nr:cytidine deaminase-like protein [Lasiosphaeria miniovina]KAK0709878.1 cytidine deaminase-like protein [Lasiosphaeria miniovina]
MSNPSTATTLLSALVRVTEDRIVPLTRAGVSSGSKLFGAAILSREGLAPLTVATNNERASPLLHGEINCIQQFFSSPSDSRPATKDCVFFATHEPCSLCLSGITWSGFNEFYYLFTYEDSRDLFSIPYDIDILEQVFRVPAPSDTPKSLAARPLYNHKNNFFTAKSLADLLQEVPDETERKHWESEVARIKELYNGLSETYQEGKKAGAESASVWK